MKLSDDEIRATYRSGEEAVVTLASSLVSTINQLEARILKLEDQVAEHSRNSSKPPSSDGFKKPESMRKPGTRRPGGQPGHKGSVLSFSDHPDTVCVHPLESCPCCGHDMHKVPVMEHVRRQVFELPAPCPEVHEHRVERKSCPGCGKVVPAPFPADPPHGVRYGSTFKAMMAYLMTHHLLPIERTAELCADLFGHRPGTGTLFNILRAGHEATAASEEAIMAALRNERVLHGDETGIRWQGRLQWLHVYCTRFLTCYAPHEKRGKDAMDAADILPGYEGTAIHDGRAPCMHYDCTHAFCNAHLLRELKFFAEEHKQVRAQEMIDLLPDIKEKVEEHMEKQMHTLSTSLAIDYEERYDRIVARGMGDAPPNPVRKRTRGRRKKCPERNPLDRLTTCKYGILLFMHDFKVAFDNNQAERDSRMIKVQQKVSGSFRGREGAYLFCRIRGYISTVGKQSIPVLRALQDAFGGTPFIPAIK